MESAVRIYLTLAILFCLTAVVFRVYLARSRNRAKASRRRAMKAPSEFYTARVQYAYHDVDESEELGEASFEKVHGLLANFPWDEQIAQVEQRKGANPTLMVLHGGLDRCFTVSGVGSKDNPSVCFFTFWGECKSGDEPLFLAFDDLKLVGRLLRWFFDGNLEEIDRIYEKRGLPTAASFEKSVPVFSDLPEAVT